MSIQERAVCASFSAGIFSARKQDKAAAKLVADTNGVDEKVGRYWKDLIKCDELDDVKAFTAQMRNVFYRNTLEWREGTRIMPTAAYVKYAVQYRDDREIWESYVQRFINAYPTIVQDAQRRLRGMFNADDYPQVELVRNKFYMDLAIFPVPSGNDFRLDIAESDIAAARQEVEERMQEAQKIAMADLYGRLYERVLRVAETLKDPHKKFWDTMITNTQEICDDIAVMNFANDPVLEGLRQDAVRSIASLNPDALRADNMDPTGYRAKAVAASNDLLKRIAQYTGA